MHLADARIAKLDLRKVLLSEPEALIRARVQSEKVHPKELERLRPIAIGIARRHSDASGALAPDDYVVALRVQAEHKEHEDESLFKIAYQVTEGAIDVRYVGRVTAREWNRQRQRPLRIGCSIGPSAPISGTLGAFVRDRGTGRIGILSNNHVLANENRGPIGDQVHQPALADNGTVDDRVGTLHRFVPLDFTGSNDVDAAVAAVTEGIDCDCTTLDGAGLLQGVRAAPVNLDDQVWKIGRTTGFTQGRVTAMELDNVYVHYDGGRATFVNQFEVTGSGPPFSLDGDSGALIFDQDRRAAGLLFAGTSDGRTYANYMAPVLDRLGVELIWGDWGGVGV